MAFAPDSRLFVCQRGIRPSLAQSGVSNFLPDLTLELHDNNIGNDNWHDNVSQATQINQDTFPGLANWA
jgi:hypothetical protein